MKRRGNHYQSPDTNRSSKTPRSQDHQSVKGKRRRGSSPQFSKSKSFGSNPRDVRGAHVDRFRSHIHTRRNSIDRSRVRSHSQTSATSRGLVEQSALLSLPTEYKQCVEIYTTSPRQLIQHPSLLDHISINEPIFHDSFKYAEEWSMCLVHRLRDAIAHQEFGLQLPANLSMALQRAYTPWLSEPARVVVMGDIGHGKSYLIAALLGDIAVVKEGNSGESITRVVLEYEYFAWTGQFKYSAVICLFPWPKVAETFEDCFQNLVNGLFPTEDEEDSEIVDQKLSTAKEVFTAIFPDGRHLQDDELLHFQDNVSLRKWLEQSKQPPLRVDLRDDVLGWVSEQYDIAKCVAEENVYVHTANQLWERIMPFTHGKRTRSSHINHDPWPFVELVRIGGAFPITKRNVRIADTPGMNDVNHLNRDRTEHYLPKCSATIIVNTIDRVLSVTGGRKNLRSVTRRAKPNHPVFLVCTKSEDAQPIEQSGLTAEESSKMSYWMTEETMIAHELSTPRQHSDTELIRFRRCLVTLKKTEILVDERNRRVKKKVQEWHSRPTRTFCVSAKDYRTSALGYHLNVLDKLPIDVKRSEMVDLKQFIAAVPTKRQQQDLTKYITNTIPSLLNSLQLLVQQMSVPQMPNTYCFVLPGGIDGQLKTCIETVNTRIATMFRSRVPKLLRIIVNSMPTILDHAELHCDEWAKWNPNSHRAFIMNYGNHATIARPHTSWNDVLLEAFRESVFTAFTSTIENTRNDLEIVNWEVQSVLDWVSSRLKAECPKPIPPVFVAFSHGIQMHKETVKAMISRHAEKMGNFYLYQRERCCEDNGGHYFDVAMRRVYERTAEVYPQDRNKCTVHRLRVNAFKAEICTPGNDNPFMKIYDGLKAACTKQELKLTEALGEDISAIFRIMADDLERTHNLAAESISPEHMSEAQCAIQNTMNSISGCLPFLKAKLVESGVVLEEEIV